ncbi:thioesterase family protein [Brevibacterium sp. HMSC07C04]|uniref:acyl-CoA thioesterase n=1 Tax=Brevibacterium sp. HMSC07C04 TaxID=1581130 RepID=UPI0008A128A6|nr:thioesterase family protein [Brevibacterium sp. HMSC07C04]OFS25826.1 thioesterase [Brevibacterium sp. HMSC07C04]
MPNEQPKPSDFPLSAIEKIRYGDTDRQGHVNNAVYATYFECGRVEIIQSMEDVFGADDAFVLATITIDYLAEVLWPGEVEIRTRLTKIGNSSIALEQLLINEGEVRAKATSVMVMTNTSTRRSAPLLEAAKERLRTFM